MEHLKLRLIAAGMALIGLYFGWQLSWHLLSLLGFTRPI